MDREPDVVYDEEESRIAGLVCSYPGKRWCISADAIGLAGSALGAVDIITASLGGGVQRLLDGTHDQHDALGGLRRSGNAVETSIFQPASTVARPAFGCSAEGSSEEVYKECQWYVCCPAGAVDTNTLNEKCETADLARSSSFWMFRGREFGVPPGFVETCIAN